MEVRGFSLPTPVFVALRVVATIWIAFLAYVAIGGTIAQVLVWTGVVGPYCTPDDAASPCAQCSLYWSVFGLVQTAPCPNALQGALLEYGVSIPRFFVVSIALFLSWIGDLLRAAHLPLVVAPAAFGVLLVVVAYLSFVAGRSLRRGLNRTLIVYCLLLASLMILTP